jgi:hypothetical protein
VSQLTEHEIETKNRNAGCSGVDPLSQLGIVIRETTPMALFMRLLALIAWTGAACCAMGAWRDEHNGVQFVALSMAFLLCGAGVGMWKGSNESAGDADAMRRSALRAEGERQ